MGDSSFKFLKITGNKKISTTKIYESLGLKLPAWYQFYKSKKAKINPKIANSLYESLGYFYRSQGFYHTHIEKSENNSTITFKIEEGKPTLVNKIEIKSDYPIKKFIDFKKNERFETSKFVEIKKRIKEHMLNKGYCNYLLNAKAYIDIKKDQANLLFSLKSNKPCRFGKITINPPKGISKKVVYSRLLYRSGDDYSLEKINKSYSTLSGLEAFDGIQLKTTKQKDLIDTDITLYAKQKPTRREIGIGYETNYGLKAFLHWNRKNFTGDAKKLSFDLKYSQKERYIKNEFFWPAFFKIPGFDHYFDFKNSFSYSRLTYENFQEQKYADKLHLLNDYDWFSLDLGIGIEQIKINKFKDVCNISSGDFFIFYPFGQMIVDLRDSKINPKKGLFFSQYVEGGLKYIFSEISFIKSISEVRAIYTINNFTLAAKSKLGLLKEIDGKLPESKLFYAGGAFSNRAYSYNALGAFDANCGEIGGRTLLDNSVEVIHPVYKQLDFALFWDSTLISSDTLKFSLDFKHAIGGGIRYNTIIGPIKFDIGFDLEDHSQYAIHFQIGQSF